MSFRDRLRPLTFISAEKGTEFTPSWDVLDRSFDKKASVHESVGNDKANVQDLGNSNQSYPFTLYFCGNDYDKIADAFYEALRESGAATLKHPRWGNLSVMPIKVHQSENFVEGLRMAVFELEFIESPPPESVVSTSATSAAIQSAADSAASTIATGAGMATDSPGKLAQMKSAVKGAVAKYRKAFQAMTGLVDSVKQEIEMACRDIESGIDDLAQDPALLAQSLVSLSRAPARAEASIRAKVEGYIDLISGNIADLAGLDEPARAALVANLSGIAVSVCEATTVGTLMSRPDAIAVRDSLETALANVSSAFDDYYTPEPAVLSAIEEIRASTRDYLLSSAFSLPSELSFTTDREYFPLDLAYKLTGNADDFPAIAEFNDWGGDFLLVIPTGVEVRYYA